MRPEEADARRLRFEALSGPGGPLGARSPQATVANRQWYGPDGHATAEREDLHRRLLEEYVAEAPAVSQDRQAVIIVGPPGAGKSGVRADVLRETGTTIQQWRHLDPDDFRDRLARSMVEDGTLSQVVPPEVAALEPRPRELSSQLFVESAKLSQAAQKAAVRRGENLLIEGAYSEERRLGQLVKELEKKGYEVHLAVVDVSLPDARERVEERYRREALKAAGPGVRGDDALGGRFVPLEALGGHFDEQGAAKATAAAEAVASRSPGVLSVRRYEVAGPDQPARLSSVAHRNRGGQAIPADLYKYGRVAGMIETLPSARQARSGDRPSAVAGRGEGPQRSQEREGGPKPELNR